MNESGRLSLEARDLEIGRILSDLHDRRARGEVIDESRLFAAHPQFADELREHLRTIRELKSTDHTIEALLRRGSLSLSSDGEYAAEFGPYKIVQPLGRGGMGIVLKAYDASLRRFVAIKLLRPDVADDETALARFTREARAAAALVHPNIIAVHAIGEQNGSQFIAMECVNGPSLSQVIRQNGPLPTKQIRSLFGQLLMGLAAAHDAGLIHRDIKSANLLLAEGNSCYDNPGNKRDVVLKVADFGLARITSSQTQLTLDNHSFGTPEYMSPEQARGDKDIDHRTDLYSAGVVLYEMLTGRTPFRASTSSAVIRRILDEVPPDPRSIRSEADPVLSSLAIRLLAKNQYDRLETASGVLAAVTSQQLIVNYERKRKQVRIGATVSVATLLLLASAWSVFGGRGEQIIDVAPYESHFIMAQRASGDWDKTFYKYPSANQVSSAAVADIDGRGKQRVFATLFHPHNGNILEAIDARGNYLWGKYSTLISPIAWPDYEPNKGWSGIQVIATTLDEEPGDELVVVTSDAQEYPTRLTIMRPATGEVLGTFWNLGDIGNNLRDDIRIRALPGFFEDGSSAILVHGLNNKLDGFQDARAENQVHWTSWEIVPVVMILDPREIMRAKECTGPPKTNLVELPQAGVYAYAFANLSVTDKASPVAKILPRDRDQGAIHGLVYVRTSSDAGTPFFKLILQLRNDKGMADLGATFNLDRNLNILNCVITPNPSNPLSKEEWTMLWVPIVQEGRWLEGKAKKP